jgi:hypothetical protein
MNSTLVLIIIAAVIVAAFWRALLKIGIAALIIGLAFLSVTGLQDVVRSLHPLFP